jgi:hypothetical protein
MGGALPVRVPNIGFDGNGQPKYYGPWNHPGVVQEPVVTLHWGGQQWYATLSYKQ